MGYVEDETREKQRADLRELGGTLREFAELEARRRNWGPAQRRLGLAMSAWQFFVIRRRHGRFLAKERARLRALGLGPPEAPPPAASDDDGGDDEPPRAALDRDVHYFLIEPDGWKHYDFYWGYTGDLVEPWKDFVAPGREFTVHRGVEGNHFQAFDTDANMDVIKAVVQPLLDGLDRRPAADAAVENE